MEDVLEHLGLVKSIAWGVFKTLPPHAIEFDDLVSVGTIGLLEAKETFDPAKGKLVNYAWTKIRGAILDELRRMDWAPRSVRAKSREMLNVCRELELQNFRHPTLQEIAEEMGMDLEVLYELLEASVRTKTSWDTPTDEVPLDVKLVLAEEVNRLSEREREVMFFYYYKGLRMHEIGEVFDRTESRISQIHKQAVEKVRKRLEGYL